MKTFAADKTTVMIHKQIPTTWNAMGGSVLRPGPFLSLVFLSFEFVWDLLLRISDFKHARTVRILHAKTLLLLLQRMTPTPTAADRRANTGSARGERL